ncbi:MAG: hypothetical protein ACLTBV_25735 [Enterocloster bolteae]
MLGDFAFQELGRQEGRLCDMSRSIWENPEGPYREYHASRLCADFLEENGFAVENRMLRNTDGSQGCIW